MGKVLKKAKRGRPTGSKKEAVNIYMHKERAEKLRDLAKTDQRTISVVVENALEQTYGI